MRTAAALGSMCLLGVLAIGCQTKVPENPGRTTWDQAEVTSLAQDLAKAIKAVRKSALLEPSMRDRTGSNQLAKSLYLDTLKELELSTGQLARKLEAGEGYDQTYGTARRIGTLLRDAQENGRKFMGTESQWNAIDPALDIIDKIAPYYSTKTPLLPPTLDR